MKYKEVIRQIVFLAFEKAKKESLQVLKTPLSKHISTKIESDYRVYVSEKTFVRYYDKFIGGKENSTGIPNRRILDFLCKYVGFDDFIDFYHKRKKRYNKIVGEKTSFLDIINLTNKNDTFISLGQLKRKKKLYSYLHAVSFYLQQKIYNMISIYEIKIKDLHYSM